MITLTLVGLPASCQDRLGLGKRGAPVRTSPIRGARADSAVGQPLFVWHQSGYRLTEDGKALIERAEETEAAARALTSGVRQEASVSGTVPLATADNLAMGLIMPRLGRLRVAYPHLPREIVTDIAPVNLRRRDADITLRRLKPDRVNVSLQRLGTPGHGASRRAMGRAYSERPCPGDRDSLGCDPVDRRAPKGSGLRFWSVLWRSNMAWSVLIQILESTNRSGS